jgi:cytochrome c biogenesis protein CcmG/thiol:disulfide interchange protein DsbE
VTERGDSEGTSEPRTDAAGPAGESGVAAGAQKASRTGGWRRALRWGENILLLVLLLWVGQRLGPQVAALVGLNLGVAESPAIEVMTRSGEPFSLAEHRGQVVLVNFWATWCRPCRIEMPGFQKVYDRYHDQGFTVLGLSTDATGVGTVDAYVRDRGVTYPVAMATLELRREFGGVREIPSSFLVDKQGRIRYTVRGFWAGPALGVAVRRLLEEQPVGGGA